MRQILFAFVALPISLSAQWNYDNQGVIYSTVSKVGLGIGSSAPNANLQVGNGTENGLLSLGGFSFIGSLRSSGDFFAGANAYAEYATSAENSKIKVYGTSAYGFSAMQLGYNGDINFYVKSGSVTANAQVNVPAYNAFKISSSGYVGVGTSSPEGYLHVNPIRPVIIKNNGGNGVYGSEIGFNAVLNTSVVPNTLRKLGGTSQGGGASIAVDYWGNMRFQMYDGNTELESTTNHVPQVAFLNNGNVGIGTVSPNHLLQVHSSDNPTLAIGKSNEVTNGKSSLYFYAGTSAAKNGFSLEYMKDASHDRLAFIDGAALETVSILNGGDVGIGTATPDARLAVKGTVHAEEVKVDLNVPGPDYVFSPGYDLLSLKEVERYVHENRHLPEVPSSSEMEADGIKLKQMNLLLLKKVEELTLHLIEQDKRIEGLEREIVQSRKARGRKKKD